MPKLVQIAIHSCARCPYIADTHIRATNGRGFLNECRHAAHGAVPRLIQRPDEDAGPFPHWCPLTDAND